MNEKRSSTSLEEDRFSFMYHIYNCARYYIYLNFAETSSSTDKCESQSQLMNTFVKMIFESSTRNVLSDFEKCV